LDLGWKSGGSEAKAPARQWRPELINARDLCDRKFPDLKYVVPGIIPEGVTLLASRPKLGKSWLVLQLASAVATGVVTLVASNAPQIGDVLYLALEDNQRRLQRRLTKLFGLNKQAWPNRLTVVTEWRRLDQGGLEELRRWCRSKDKPALIVIDVLKMVRPPKKQVQTDYEADYAACEGLRELAAEFGIGIIVVTHDRKMGADDVFDTVSGTLGLTGGVDTIAILKRNAQGVTLHVEGRDLTEKVEKAVTFDRETCRWAIVGEAAEVLRSAERSRVLRALQDAPGGLSTSEIVSIAQLRGRNAADLLLSRMASDALIERVKRGLYGLPGTRAELALQKERQKDRQKPLRHLRHAPGRHGA
jgi:AAA domain